MIKMNCPQCKRPLQIPEQSAGQTSECEHCQHKFTVPAPATKRKWLIYTMAGAGVFLIGVEIFLRISGISTPPGPKSEMRNAQKSIPEAVVKSKLPPPPVPIKTPGEKLLMDALRIVNSDTKVAFQALEKVRAEYPEAITSPQGLYFATVYAQLGERAKHETLCRWLFDIFPEEGDVVDTGRTGKAYVLYPGADNPELLQQAANRIKIAAESPDVGHVHWRNVARGMADYRLKNYQEAAGWLQKEVENENTFIQSLALAYSAMVEHEQGNTSKSLERLETARTLIANFPLLAQKNSNVMTSKIALKEAEILLGQPITEYAPSAKSFRDQIKEVTELAFQGNYQQAVQVFENIHAEYPDALSVFHGYLIAILYAQLGEHEKHEAHCQWMFEKVPWNERAVTASRTGKAYVLYPRADNPELLQQAANRIKFGAERAAEGANHFQNVARGMAEYRMKNHQEAMQWLEKEVASERAVIQSLALAYSAMVEHELGNTAKSLESLAAARTVIADFPELDIDRHKISFAEFIVSKIALKEAQALLGQPITTDIPTAKLPEDQRDQTNELTDQAMQP